MASPCIISIKNNAKPHFVFRGTKLYHIFIKGKEKKEKEEGEISIK